MNLKKGQQLTPRSENSFPNDLESSLIIEERVKGMSTVLKQQYLSKRSHNYSSFLSREGSMTNLANFTNSFTNKKPSLMPAVIEATNLGHHRRNRSKR